MTVYDDELLTALARDVALKMPGSGPPDAYPIFTALRQIRDATAASCAELCRDDFYGQDCAHAIRSKFNLAAEPGEKSEE